MFFFSKILLIHLLDISTIVVMSLKPLGIEIQPMDLSGVVSELYHSFMYFYTLLSKVLKSCPLFLGFCLNMLMMLYRQLESYCQCCGYIYNMCLNPKFIDFNTSVFDTSVWASDVMVHMLIHTSVYYCFSEH